VITMERIAGGERIRRYVVEGMAGSSWRALCEGSAVGHKKIDRIEPVRATKVRLRVLEAAATPQVRKFAVYAAGR